MLFAYLALWWAFEASARCSENSRRLAPARVKWVRLKEFIHAFKCV